MDAFYRPTWVEISLDALRYNLGSFRGSLPAGMRIMAVVKADAYGHGAVQVARECMAQGAEYLAVAFMDEALELRRAGITDPVLVLGYTPAEAVALAVKYDITINVYSWDVLEALAARSSGEPPVRIHIKMDSGMGRLGLNRVEEAIAFIERALELPGVEVEGLFTHYACADETDKTYTLDQHRRFDRVVGHFQGKGITFPYIHAGNTATAIDSPEISYNMVRLGIGMYGLYPSEEVKRERVELRPVMSLKTRVVMLKSMEEGAGVSYGALYHASEGEQVATLAVGYADGFSRMLTGKAQALIRGKRVPVVGRVCMDQCMISLHEVAGAKLGDEVVMFGEQEGERLTAEELAAHLGTVNYEIVCMISHRVPRVYVEDGRVVNTVNLLQHPE